MEIKDLQDKIKKRQSLIDQKKGEKKQAEKDLKEAGFKSLSSAKEYLEKSEKKLIKLRANYQDELAKIKEDYPWIA